MFNAGIIFSVILLVVVALGIASASWIRRRRARRRGGEVIAE
jgi:hypothetical protein